MSRTAHLLLAGSILAFGIGLGLAWLGHELIAAEPAARSTGAPAPDLETVGRARILRSDDLPDAAIAVYDSLAPAIYLNSRLLAEIGPEVSAFLLAHEQGHLAYHHVPERRFGLVRVETPVPVLHTYELAADCYAARTLRREQPLAVHAALRFFQRRRDLVTDAAHPSMGVRADRLIDCLTDPSASPSSRADR